ncbi:MAG: bacteriohopanetetrol glucosamine biosynthesis glycosyltransferase HpnI [Acidobacteria bacterium]|nr:bacteriohopanetetrol glucosamine biosynthesis glycosyltransferase HpnI [Acidobacteriota bacterium]MCZ6753285.1 bacteriohopanetetrol glucosamine biosynthesis glycosyltransferase HpnI [Acidobacteriota bacterium]
MVSLSFIAAVFLFHLPLILAVCSCMYHLAVFCAALQFRCKPEEEASSDFAPPVSILKPVHGIEQGFYSGLASHFRQDYPHFEIVFGLSGSKDPAQWTIAQLRRDFPHVPVKVVTMEDAGSAHRKRANPKMNKLEPMLEQAEHEIVLMNDSDISVESDYLRQVVRPLRNPRTGLVTCLYRGVPAGGIVSILESLGISGDFAGQVLLARSVKGVRFALGATLVTRKKQIAEIGGLAPWADYLADDYILGNKIAAAGYPVHLSHTVVDTTVPRRSFFEMFRHQLRWARTIRFSNPRGYPALLLTFGIPLALVALLFRPDSPLAQAVLAGTLAARFLAAWASGVLVCRDRVMRKFFWLLPIRDLVALGVWITSFMGNHVVWRGERFRIEAGGKIKPV